MSAPATSGPAATEAARAPPAGLSRWRRLLVHLQNFARSVATAVLVTAATALHPALKDRILAIHFSAVPSVAWGLTDEAQTAAREPFLEYPVAAARCDHVAGTRKYGAAGYPLAICDLCGSRWLSRPQGRVPIRAKASPHAKTPLGIPEHLRLGKNSPAKALAAPPRSAASSQDLRPSSARPAGGLLRQPPPPPPRAPSEPSTVESFDLAHDEDDATMTPASRPEDSWWHPDENDEIDY